MSGEREYKDGFFRAMLNRWAGANERFLDVCDAVLGTSWAKSNAKVTSANVRNVFYTKCRNDVAKVVDDVVVVLMEHQSTLCANMPLRMLSYIDKIYSKLVNPRLLYGSKTIKLPEPVFVVLYNGAEKAPLENEQKLSEAFKNGVVYGSLELNVKVLNVKMDKGSPLLQKSKVLHDYAKLCDFIEQYQKAGYTDFMARGVQKAIDEGVMSECLKKHFSEVTDMFVYDYNEDLAVHVEEAMEKVAESLLRKGVDINTICEATGLSVEQIAELQSQVMA